jgi:hypothetical protein
MEIKNETMGVEKLLVFVDQVFFSRVFDDEKVTQKSFKIRTDGFLKLNNSKMFKNKKKIMEFPQKCIKNKNWKTSTCFI